MTIRTFWTFLLKLLGLWLILSSFTVLSQLFSMVGYMTYGDGGTAQVILILAGSLLVLAIYTAIILFIVIKPGLIIDKLKLDKGFQEETIHLNIKMNTVLIIAVIILGGIMFIDALPVLCREVIVFMQGTDLIREYPNKGTLIFLLAKTLIGYLLMTNSKTVVRFIVKKEEEVEA
jgi:hypothetical protein